MLTSNAAHILLLHLEFIDINIPSHIVMNGAQVRTGTVVLSLLYCPRIVLMIHISRTHPRQYMSMC